MTSAFRGANDDRKGEIVIRCAALADKSRIVTLLKHSREAAGFDHTADGTTGFCFPFDPAYAERLFLLHLQAHRLAIVLEADGCAQGVLMAIAAEHPFGPVRLARETVWWIEPDYRGSGALRMLGHYEQWAAAEGCAFVSMAGLGEFPDVGRLYLRRGYRPAETHFLRAI
jgi:GNAT superfamily N-acetyltransferase